MVESIVCLYLRVFLAVQSRSRANVPHCLTYHCPSGRFCPPYRNRRDAGCLESWWYRRMDTMGRMGTMYLDFWQ
ncbi:hypothetical protein GCK32_013380 [Trichostrongylus colubriformis]|uniref:Uncharacterized protein n=1 Tax=Trichostrongylus colubriformis TaxID=6319 RepID=A0AAN8ITC3_TRICO